MKKCIVHGCTNREGEGAMQGVLCMPCYIMLTGGAVTSPGRTFIHDIVRSNQHRLEALEKIRGLATTGTYYE